MKLEPKIRLTDSAVFKAGKYDFNDSDGIFICADEITIDGNGAHLVGGCKPEGNAVESNTEEFAYGSGNADNGRSLGFSGFGIVIENRRNVTIKNFRASGFDIGLVIKNSSNIRIENCDFSECFHDPAWGWDDHGFHGGILMENVSGSSIINCRAQNVWDAINMRYSNNNVIQNNIFSYTSDTGIKLWNACNNLIEDNDFSWGLRIDPGEVHARDSSSVLIESGSNDNIFRRNDMTHGGDGLFIRVLNGWMSTGNLFEDNDCSYANNNAIEAWADNNTYIRNKANYSSYGFWLGNSDGTVLIENEIAHNGKEFCNAPETFGNAGLAIVNGSGSHSIIKKNYIHNNNGPGIAIRNTKKTPSYHMLLQENIIENNTDTDRYKGYGIYLKNANGIILSGNSFNSNQSDEIFIDSNVSDLTQLHLKNSDAKEIEDITIKSPEVVIAGKEVSFSACSVDEALHFCWNFDDGKTAVGQHVNHTFAKTGLHRLALSVDNGEKAALAWQNIYVLPAQTDTMLKLDKTEITGDAAEYKICQKTQGKISKQESLLVKAAKGKKYTLHANLNRTAEIKQDDALYFFMHFASDADPDWNKKSCSPIIKLYDEKNNFACFKAKQPFTQTLFSPVNEERDNGRLFVLPFCETDDFEYSANVEQLNNIHRIEIQIETAFEGISELELDAIFICPWEISGQKPDEAEKLAICTKVAGKADKALASEGTKFISCQDGILPTKIELAGDICPRSLSKQNGYYGIDFGSKRFIDGTKVSFYENHIGTSGSNNESLPLKFWLEAEIDGEFHELTNAKATTKGLTVDFKLETPVFASAVRICFNVNQAPVSICAFMPYFSKKVIAKHIKSKTENLLDIKAFEVLLNIEINGNSKPLGNLTAALYSLDADEKLAQCLWQTQVEKNLITPYIPLRIPANISGINPGVRYALCLGQTEKAKSRTEGDYYRWVGGQAGYDEKMAIFSGGETLPSDYDWGTGWLKIDCGKTWADLSHDSEHVGARFGLEGIDCRYMTFTLNDECNLLIDGKIDTECSYVLEKNNSLEFTLEKAAKEICVWGKPGAEIIAQSKTTALSAILNESGFCQIDFGEKTTAFTIKSNASAEIYQVEALNK